MLISVIIPMYNSEKTIERSINSILNQKAESILEIIVVNDGSKDNSLEIVKNIIKTKPRFEIKIINQLNKGVATARNVGVNSSSGQYIAFLDSDDEWMEDKIFNQMNILQSDERIDLIGGNFLGLNVNFSKLDNIGNNVYHITFNNLLNKHYFQPSTVIMKKSVFVSSGGFEDGMTHGEEGLLFYNICYKNKCVLMSEEVINYGDNKHPFASGAGLASNLVEMEKSELKNYYKIFSKGMIPFSKYISLSIFSVLKFVRRIFIKWTTHVG